MPYICIHLCSFYFSLVKWLTEVKDSDSFRADTGPRFSLCKSKAIFTQLTKNGEPLWSEISLIFGTIM